MTIRGKNRKSASQMCSYCKTQNKIYYGNLTSDKVEKKSNKEFVL